MSGEEQSKMENYELSGKNYLDALDLVLMGDSGVNDVDPCSTFGSLYCHPEVV